MASLAGIVPSQWGSRGRLRFATLPALGMAALWFGPTCLAGPVGELRVLENTPDRIIIQFELGPFTRHPLPLGRIAKS